MIIEMPSKEIFSPFVDRQCQYSIRVFRPKCSFNQLSIPSSCSPVAGLISSATFVMRQAPLGVIGRLVTPFGCQGSFQMFKLYPSPTRHIILCLITCSPRNMLLQVYDIPVFGLAFRAEVFAPIHYSFICWFIGFTK
jgi:hypothetical protein